jgi:hypothetical protein
MRILFYLYIDVGVRPCTYGPMEFVTLKDGSEGLIIYDDGYKFLDPFLPSSIINITNIITNNHKKIIITKSNRKLSIVENNVLVTDGLNEDMFQQMLNKTTYHSNIYTQNYTRYA